jgi:4-hydroxybenzoyl-CoA thioesterase
MPGRFEQTIRIRFGHCDPAGIVFYPQYLVLFNGLVEDWVDQALGISYAGLIGARRVGLPTVRLECDFRAVSRMGEDVVLGLEVERLGTRSLTLAVDVRQSDEVRVTARVVLVSTDLATHRAMALPDDLRQAVTDFGPRSQSETRSRSTTT